LPYRANLKASARTALAANQDPMIPHPTAGAA